MTKVFIEQPLASPGSTNYETPAYKVKRTRMEIMQNSVTIFSTLEPKYTNQSNDSYRQKVHYIFLL